jgi:hypothetical protein
VLPAALAQEMGVYGWRHGGYWHVSLRVNRAAAERPTWSWTAQTGAPAAREMPRNARGDAADGLAPLPGLGRRGPLAAQSARAACFPGACAAVQPSARCSPTARWPWLLPVLPPLQDVTSLRDYYDANLALASPRPTIAMSQVDGLVASAGSCLPPASIDNVTMENVLLGDGSVLRVRRAGMGCGRRGARGCCWGAALEAAAGGGARGCAREGVRGEPAKVVQGPSGQPFFAWPSRRLVSPPRRRRGPPGWAGPGLAVPGAGRSGILAVGGAAQRRAHLRPPPPP